MTTHAEDVRLMRAELDALVASLNGFAKNAEEKLQQSTKPPSNAIALVKEAVQDPEVTRFNFREWIASKLPNFFCGPSKAQVMEVFSLVFGSLVALQALQQTDMRDPSDFATCSRNATWPLLEDVPSVPSEILPPYGQYEPMAAQPKGTSVVDQVFTKEAELRARRCSSDARGAR